MKKLLKILALSAAVLCIASSAHAAQSNAAQAALITVEVEGVAPVKDNNKNAAREEAKLDAYRSALEQAMGARVEGITEMENYAIVKDKVFSQTKGIVKKFDILSEKIDSDGMLVITAKCGVAETALDGVLGPAVLNAIGNPRILFIIDEIVKDAKPHISATESEALRVFEKAGYLIIDPDQARALITVDPAAAFNDPSKVMDVARTTRADVVVLGKAYADSFYNDKKLGIPRFSVETTVQLKAVLTKTAYQITSQTVEAKTKNEATMARSIAEGAAKFFAQATNSAANQIVHKIAYALVSGQEGGVTGAVVNIKISNISFQQAQAIQEALNELAGKSGSVFERGYKDKMLEIDVNSEKTAKDIASFLAGQGVEIEGYDSQTVTGSMAEAAPAPEETPASEGSEKDKSGGVL
ncbi:MAG: flagellar assembly protein T N-terminal domain-containing protein [Synergistaceae bacterium]|jgi:hypothetical protein|nr:flagellar assembly protein T N-terminal domain-containing protein [Synergistaceae bacterium]